MEYDEQISELLSQAESLTEGLSDLGFKLLREGFNKRDENSLTFEKDVAKARRGVEKAVHLLRALGNKLEKQQEQQSK